MVVVGQVRFVVVVGVVVAVVAVIAIGVVVVVATAVEFHIDVVIGVVVVGFVTVAVGGAVAGEGMQHHQEAVGNLVAVAVAAVVVFVALIVGWYLYVVAVVVETAMWCRLG